MIYYSRLTLVYQDPENCIFIDTNKTHGDLFKMIDSDCDAINTKEVHVDKEEILYNYNVSDTKLMIKSSMEESLIEEQFDCDEVSSTHVVYRYCATIIQKAES